MTIRERLFAVFMPKRCVFCDRVIAPLYRCCLSCAKHIVVAEPPLCPYCGRGKTECRCDKRRQMFDKIAAPFYYEASVRSGILRLKRYDDPEAIAYFAERMCMVVQREFAAETIDGLTYVPMTKHDLRAREYNQSKRLAEALSKRMDLPIYAVLSKIYDTPPQKELDYHARAGNLLGVFEVIDTVVRGKTLLMVDDVMTTGATLNECAKMLKIYGAKRVLAVTAAVKKEPDEIK